tara:strand:+ start:16525 stop:17667 length:1143 start_codon:yes stop_codon:yes gene_type:complete
MTPPLSLYVHLPWCERKCPYCDFNSHEAVTLPETDYVQALLDDLSLDAAAIGTREVHSVFIGGGTPSLFSAAAIERLLAGIGERVALASDIEISLEANPGSAEAEKFTAFRQAGVNRLSLGIQSFDDNCLARLGRVHSAQQAADAIGHARAAEFDSFNIDLMHGLPGQSVDIALGDLTTAIDHQPGHLSWYQLTIEPNTAFYNRPPILPTEDSLACIQSRGEALLRSAGYVQYEVSAWSRPGAECRHNLNYWNFGDYLGIGAGAHAKLSNADGTVIRYVKRRQPADYLATAASGKRIASRRTLSPDDLAGEFAMNALRLNAGFSLALFTQHTGLDRARLHRTLDSLGARGLLTIEADRVATTTLGSRFLDSVVAEFFADD